MNATTGNLLVWVGDSMACVRVMGRANFTTSVDFKKLMRQLQASGCQKVVLDLTECILMDSTFLGVLASEGHRQSAPEGDRPQPSLELVNPNQRIRDLIDNLGVTHLFKILECNLSKEDFKLVEPAADTSRDEITRTCLEAHQALMALNPANVPKFKDVAQFFADALKKPQEPATD
jgi:anti-sigma B factor antagonist